MRGKEVFMSPEDEAPFIKIYKATEDIVGFAAGNNEFFFSNIENYRTRFKLNIILKYYIINQIIFKPFIDFIFFCYLVKYLRPLPYLRKDFS